MKRTSHRNCSNWRSPVIALLVLIFAGLEVPAESLDQSFLPVVAVPGRVNQMIRQPDGKLVVVGEFKSVDSSYRSYVARLNPNGSVDQGFDTGLGANGAAYTVALQPDGKILVGGAFTAFNKVVTQRLVRLSPDGAVDRTFSVAGDVRSIAVQPDGKILVGGSFTALIVRFNSDGSPDATFQSNPGPFSGTTSSIILGPDSKIYVGGSFSNWGTTETGGFVRLQENGVRDTTFNSGGSGVSGAVVHSAFLQDGKILVAGVFLFVNGVARKHVARLNADGTLDQTFRAIINGFEIEGSVASFLLLADGRILIGGEFFTLGGVSNRMARLHSNGDWDSSFNTGSGFDTRVQDLEADGAGFIVAGHFKSVNAESRFGMARLQANGGLESNFTPGFGITTQVLAVKAVSGGRILLGGSFDLVNGRPRTKMAVVNGDGSLDETFVLPLIEGTNVSAFAIQPDGKILVGGLFSRVDGVNNRTLIRLDPAGNLDLSFNMNTLFSNGIYRLEVLPSGKILVAGDITPVGGQFETNFARLNSDGSVDNTFTIGSGFNLPTTGFKVQNDGRIVVIGAFNSVAGIPRAGVARLNEGGTVDQSFAVTVSPLSIFGVDLQPDGKVVLVGGFDTVNGSSRRVIVRLNSDSSVDGSLASPFAGGGASTVLIRPNGKILLGGTLVVHSQARGFVQLNPNGTVNNSINADIEGSTSSMEIQPDGRILAGGRYDRLRAVDIFQSQQPSLIRLTPKAIDFDFDGDGRTGLAIYRPTDGTWWVNRSSNGSTFAAQFGDATDRIVPADYTGDEKTDIALWRPSTGDWYVLRSEDFSFYSGPFGSTGDIPTPADYDADGKADVAVFRPSTGTWYVQRSTGGISIQGFGVDGDLPVAGDYDGDGRADLGIFRPSNGQWWLNRSTAGVIAATFGTSSDKLIPGDYTGDGKSDVAVWRPSNGGWYVLRSEDFSFYSGPFGTNGDIPSPGDFDGDGKFDPSVFRPSNATWYSQRSTGGTSIQQFGVNGDRPVPNAFVP